MLEVYQFINPISGAGLEAEKNLVSHVEHLQRKVSVRFVPLLSMATVQTTLKEYAQDFDLNERNRYAQIMYRISLDFKAMQLQGNRVARQFLMAVQEQLLTQQATYSLKLAQNIINQFGFDYEIFLEDRDSELVSSSLQSDLKLAQEFGIAQGPAAIIYDSNRFDYELKLTSFDHQTLSTILIEEPAVAMHEYHLDEHVTEVEEG